MLFSRCLPGREKNDFFLVFSPSSPRSKRREEVSAIIRKTANVYLPSRTFAGSEALCTEQTILDLKFSVADTMPLFPSPGDPRGNLSVSPSQGATEQAVFPPLSSCFQSREGRKGGDDKATLIKTKSPVKGVEVHGKIRVLGPSSRPQPTLPPHLETGLCCMQPARGCLVYVGVYQW